MTTREQRTVWIGVGVIAVLFLVLRVVPDSIRRYSHLKSRTRGAMATVRAARATVAARQALQDSLGDAARQLIALAPQLLEGASAAEASASLSAELSLVARDAGMRLVTFAPGEGTTVEPFATISARAELEGDVAGLADLLAAIETGQPLLSVTSLLISTPGSIAPANAPEVLRVSLQVAGWYLARGGS